MTGEQLGALGGLLLGGIFVATTVYSAKKRKIKPSAFGLFLAFMFALLAVTEFFGGDTIWPLSTWVACVLMLSFILKLVDKKLDKKLALSLVLLVFVAVGIPANAYVFSMSTGWLTRILSLSMLSLIVVLIVVPMLLSLTAFSIGKRSLSKKIIKWLFGSFS